MKRTTMLVVLSAVLATVVFAAGAQDSGSAAAEIPEIYYDVGEGDPSIAKTTGYEEVQQWIVDQIGVKVHSLYSPAGDGAKINLLLASGEPLDIFTGSWTVYKSLDAIQPITEPLDKYGQDVYKAWPEDFWKLMTDSEGEI